MHRTAREVFGQSPEKRTLLNSRLVNVKIRLGIGSKASHFPGTARLDPWFVISLFCKSNMFPCQKSYRYCQESFPQHARRMPMLIRVFAGRTSFCWFCRALAEF